MFKKKNIEKKTDISSLIQTIQTPKNAPQSKQNQTSKRVQSIDKQLIKQEHLDESKKPSIRYGLIQKQMRQPEEKPKLQNFFLNLYIKKRMQQIQVKESRQANDTTASEILQMQKQYLFAAQSKITAYDVKQIQKKLQKLAINTIKGEVEQRNNYLINLLQNEHERMEYASKKQIKVLKQEQERTQRNLASKYASQGRRNFIQSAKNFNLASL